MRYTIDDIVLNTRIVKDSKLSPSIVKEIIFRIVYLMVSDIIKNGTIVLFPKRNGVEPIMSATLISENKFEMAYRIPKGLCKPDYFSSMHKAYHITIKRAGFDYYSSVDLDRITFNRLIDKISIGFNYSLVNKERNWNYYVELIFKYYDDIEPRKIRNIALSALYSIYRISQSEDILDIEYEVSDDYVFKASFGNSNHRNLIDSSEEIPNFITFPDFNGHYYIPVTYDKAVFLSRNRFNSIKNIFVTTSLDLAKMKSEYVLRVNINKNYGVNTVVENIKFKEFLLISREPEFEKEFLLVKYLSNPEI